jgi:carbohydrate kinase (thermoresistant glucokinase family)
VTATHSKDNVGFFFMAIQGTGAFHIIIHPEVDVHKAACAPPKRDAATGGSATPAIASIDESMNRKLYVVMGITGSGKSTVGAAFARAIGVDFVEGDDYHPVENVRRMAAGVPLTDNDRADWLGSLADRIRQSRNAGTGLVLTCSALKRSYRDVLRAAAPELQFVLLKGSRALIAERLADRREHFMPASLLDSQLETLEEPALDEHAWVYDVSASPQEIVDDLMGRATL